MAYELKQELRLSQNLVMTPQLQLAIKLLQLSMLDLVEMVREEIQTNPVLEDTVSAEEATPPEAVEKEAPKPEIDWEAYIENQNDYGRPRLDFNVQSEDDDFLGNISASAGGLREHLKWQLGALGICPEETRLADFIIGNIDDDGYLRLLERGAESDDEFEAAVLKEICRLTGVSGEEAGKALLTIQQFDPAGVGARTLRECLLIQAMTLPVRDTVSEEIIARHLEELGGRNYKAIARSLGVTAEEVIEAAKTINKCLNPTPGAGWGATDAHVIVPDVYIYKVGDDYVISLNEDGLPKLKISRYYRELLKADGAKPEAKAYLQDKLKSALWLIKSVHQRQRTIYRVVECVVKFQRDFLDKGLRYLRPLVLKDIATEIGVHESTVSRVTSNKYVETPRGIYELKYFFSSGMSDSGGADVTAEYIKEKIKGIIESEDPAKPLSDKAIVDALKASGITLARRTVTKYREALGCLSSNRRKNRF